MGDSWLCTFIHTFRLMAVSITHSDSQWWLSLLDNKNCLAISPISSSFYSLTKYVIGLRAPATFYSSKLLSIKRQLSLSQTLQSSRNSPESRPAHSPFTPRDSEHPWDIITALSNDRRRTKNSCPMPPHWSGRTLSFHRQMHCEKEIKSTCD